MVICTGTIHGMETEQKQNYISKLSLELKEQIIIALHSADSVDEVIKNLHEVTLISSEFHTLINTPCVIRKIIRDLAQKFNKATEKIAKELNTSGAKNYINQSKELPQAKTAVEAQKFISLGADVQFQGTDTKHNNILTKTIFLNKAPLEVIELIVATGADTNYYEEKCVHDLSPLMAAVICQVGKKRLAKKHDAKTIALLLAHNANPNIAVSKSHTQTNTPIAMASAFGLVEIVKLLINAPVAPNIEELKNALSWAKKGLILTYSTAKEAQEIEELIKKKLETTQEIK